MAIGSPQWMYASGEAYEIDQSLKFNDDDSAYLSWTPSSAGNLNKWTWSGWVKRGNITNSSYPALFGAYISSSVRDVIRFTNTDELSLQVQTASATYTKTSNAKYRDPSAWLHIIVVWDSANATASHRIRMYVNGSEITLTGTDVASGSPNSCINNTNSHFLGARSSDGNPSAYHDGFLGEVNFIDGQALTPADFGETGDYGEWKPIEYSGTYGTNGFYLNFAGGGVMSATGGNSTTTDGDYKAASFTSNGTFTPSADGYVEYLVIGGGGAGAASGASQYHGGAGGGGAGAYRTGYLPVTGGTGYSIVVGAGGTGVTYAVSGGGARGSSSSFSTITSTGGGGGSAYGYPASPSNTGGNNSSGGGGQGKSDNSSHAGGAGGTYGNSGGDGHAGGTAGAPNYGAGGGGGSGAAGADGTTSAGGNGGAGTASSITGSSVTRAGGGGGSTFNNQGTQGSGGSGGGGAAGSSSGTNGTANTGSGGGGAKDASGATGGSGGSGIVIIRYKFQ